MCVFVRAIKVVDASTCLTKARPCTSFLILVSFNFPLLVTCGSPAGPWPPGFLTESCAVGSQGVLGVHLGLP